MSLRAAPDYSAGAVFGDGSEGVDCALEASKACEPLPGMTAPKALSYSFPQTMHLGILSAPCPSSTP